MAKSTNEKEGEANATVRSHFFAELARMLMGANSLCAIDSLCLSLVANGFVYSLLAALQSKDPQVISMRSTLFWPFDQL